jgi:hypothetical protein
MAFRSVGWPPARLRTSALEAIGDRLTRCRREGGAGPPAGLCRAPSPPRRASRCRRRSVPQPHWREAQQNQSHQGRRDPYSRSPVAVAGLQHSLGVAMADSLQQRRRSCPHIMRWRRRVHCAMSCSECRSLDRCRTSLQAALPTVFRRTPNVRGSRRSTRRADLLGDEPVATVEAGDGIELVHPAVLIPNAVDPQRARRRLACYTHGEIFSK